MAVSECTERGQTAASEEPLRPFFTLSFIFCLIYLMIMAFVKWRHEVA